MTSTGNAGWLAVPVILAATVWFPVTGNYFYGDDLRTLYDIINKPLGELLIVPYAGHVQIARNAVYALVYRLAGPNPAAGYACTLLTHLVNVGLLAVIVCRLTGSARLACFGGVLWGTAPLIEGTIGWYAVWGHALATTVLLVVMDRILRAGARGDVGRAERLAWIVLVGVGSTFFGVGLAFATVLPAIAWLTLPPGGLRWRAVGTLAAAAVTAWLLYLGAARLAAMLYGGHLAPSPLVLPRSLPALADLVTGMIAFGLGRMALGPIVPGAEAVAWTAGAAPLVVGITVALARRDARAARRMAAFALLAVATYGIIAAGRVHYYATAREMLIGSERYHYAGTLALAVLLCLSLDALGGWLRVPARVATALLLLWLCASGVTFAAARRPIDQHVLQRSLTEKAMRSLRNLVSGAETDEVYVANRPFLGVGPLVVLSPWFFPRLAGLFLVFHPDGRLDGRRVLFVEAEERVRVAAARGVRSRSVLVAPDAVPAGARVLEPDLDLRPAGARDERRLPLTAPARPAQEEPLPPRR